MISANPYYAAYHWKSDQVFSIFMKDIQYQAGKKFKAGTNLNSVIFQEYHDFLDVFLKKKLRHSLSISKL